MDNSPLLSIAISLGPNRARIFLRGELDLKTVETLHARFDETFSRDDRRSLILLDLSDITFCDATGLHALTDLADKCRRLGATLRLVNVPPSTHRVIALSIKPRTPKMLVAEFGSSRSFRAVSVKNRRLFAGWRLRRGYLQSLPVSISAIIDGAIDI